MPSPSFDFRFLRALIALFCFAAALPLAAQRGALTQPRTLAELVQQSQTIVKARVVSARVEPHPSYPGLSTVVVTVAVDESLKGSAPSLLTYRQLVWDIRDVHDAAGYRKGQQYILLLNPPTRLGLTSTAGLEQGRFRVVRDEDGRELAVNGYGNANLAIGQPLGPMAGHAKTAASGPLTVDELTSAIRAAAR